jgi:peptidoglycan hydrolase-like protein with peptidoglycan-binding domain
MGAAEMTEVHPAAPATSHPARAPSIKPTTREMQQALKNAGFYQGAVDGKRGPLTKEAIREFQRVNGLKVDGVVGKQTWSKLSAYADLSSASGELNAAESLK